MITILARKSALFTDYVRWSVIKDATPEAIDVTADRSTIKVATQAVQERRIIEFERRATGARRISANLVYLVGYTVGDGTCSIDSCCGGYDSAGFG